jgi:hypothetical protein
MPQAKTKHPSKTKAKAKDSLTKFQRYRREKSRRGMKLLRMWVPDPSTAAFQKEARRQGALLRNAPDEIETLRFIEAAMDWPEE